MRVVKFPLRLREGRSGVWIEDASNLTICDFNPLLLDDADLRERTLNTAEIMTNGPTLLELCREAKAILMPGQPLQISKLNLWLDKALPLLAHFEQLAKGRENQE